MKKDKRSTIILIIMLIAGLSLLLYPSFSNYWNSFRQSYAVANYVEQVTQLDNQEYEKIWKKAVEYNENLRDSTNRYILTEEMKIG